MDNSLSFDEDEKKMSGSNWQLGLTSNASFEADECKMEYQHQNLQVIRKRTPPTVRPIIAATLHEKLAYYRAFVSSPSKTQIICMMQVRFNRFLWYYIINVFCKSLPNTYVYIFLSSYAAEEHFFVTKMVPISCGFIWASIFCGFFSLVIYTVYVIFLIDYFVCGLLFKNPWNHCEIDAHTYGDYTVHCLNVIEFAEIYQNVTPVFMKLGYMSPYNDPHVLFQVAPIVYFRSRSNKFHALHFQSYFWMYYAFVWIVAALMYKQLFKRHIWKILHYTHLALICMLLMVFVHLVVSYFEMDFRKVQVPVAELTHDLWNADIDMLAESTTGPPIIHILTARGTEEINPSRDSTIVIASNAFFYIFRGLLAYIMKRYCENKIGVPIQLTDFNPYSSFFFWPIYFSYFYLGDLMSITYFFLNAVMELMVVVITFQCLVEAIVWEYPWMGRWLPISLMTIIAILSNILINYTPRALMYIYWCGVTTLAEVIILYCCYPLRRLVDDITFHMGNEPTTLRILNLRIVPIFYSLKLYTMLSGFMRVTHQTFIRIISPYYVEELLFTITPFVIGIFYATYSIVYKQKRSWKQLFIPTPEWGPKDFNARQLRKQYDSREYIGSQATRDLSRYLLEKAELKTHRLDIPYESHVRSSIMHAEVRHEDEKPM